MRINKKKENATCGNNIKRLATTNAISDTEMSSSTEGEPFKDTRDGPYAWFILVIMFLIKSIIVGTFITYGVLFAEILKQGNLTREQLSWQFATITPTENFSCLFVSFLSVYISWCQSEFIASVLGTIANLGAFFSESRALDIVLIGVVGGLCQAFTVVPMMAINNAYFKKYRSTAYGIMTTGPYCGALVLQYLVSNAIRNYGLKYGYLVLGLANSINLILSLFVKRPAHMDRIIDDNSNSDHHSVPKDLKVLDAMKLYVILLKKPYFHLVWITQLIFYWYYSSMSLLIIDYGHDRGLNNDQANNLLTIYSMASLLGRLVPAFLLDLRIIPVRYAASMACCFTGLALLLMTLAPVGLYWSYAALTASIGFTIGFLYIMLNLLYVEYAGEGLISISFGLAAFIDGWFMVARPKVIGYFRDYLNDYNILFQLMYTVCIGIGICWLLASSIGRLFQFCFRRSKAVISIR